MALYTPGPLAYVCRSTVFLMSTMFALFNFGGGEIVLIVLLVLILFGAKKIPELAKGLGQGIKEFKKATKDVTDEIHSAMDDDRYVPPPPRQIEPPTPSDTAEPPNRTRFNIRQRRSLSPDRRWGARHGA